MSFNDPTTTIAGSDVEGTISGNDVQTADSGRRVVLRAATGAVELYSGNADEIAPGTIEPVQGGANFGVTSIKSPDLGGGYSWLDLESYNDGHTSWYASADNMKVEAGSSLNLINFGGAVHIGGDYGAGNGIDVTGNAVSQADLSDATNVFPSDRPSIRTVYKTADTTVNNTTGLATDPELALSGIGIGNYSVELFILYSSSAVANWKGFLTATGSIADRLLTVQRNPVGGGAYGDQIAEGAVTFTAVGAGVGTKRAVRITGSIRVTAAGQAFNLQWAQNTLDATNTVVHKGSWYRLQKI